MVLRVFLPCSAVNIGKVPDCGHSRAFGISGRVEYEACTELHLSILLEYK